MNRRVALWRVAYALAWVAHWPVLALGGAGMGVSWLAGVFARWITAGLRIAREHAYPAKDGG